MGFFRTISNFGKLSTSLSNILFIIKDKVKTVCPTTQLVALAVIKILINSKILILRSYINSTNYLSSRAFNVRRNGKLKTTSRLF